MRREGTLLSVPLSSPGRFFRLLTQPTLRERSSTYRLQAAGPAQYSVCVCGVRSGDFKWCDMRDSKFGFVEEGILHLS